jgi:hypothetical protein
MMLTWLIVILPSPRDADVFFYIPAFSVHPEMVDFGSGQGRSDFETTSVARLRRGFQQSENAGRGQKMPFMDRHSLYFPAAH